MTAAKRAGTAWEKQIVDFLRLWAWPNAERRALAGRNDRGDIAGIVGVVIEAKSAKRLEPSAWLDEVAAEVRNDHADIGAVWIKRRGKTSPGNGIVMMDGATFVYLLDSAGY